MKPGDEIRISLVREWIAKAEIDYITAARLSRDPEPIRESIVFHCQQAVEKYLKAVLVLHQIEFPKTHNIALLLDLLSAADPRLAASLTGVEILTPFGVELRCPGDFPNLLPGQERELFALTETARKAILEAISEQGIGNP